MGDPLGTDTQPEASGDELTDGGRILAVCGVPGVGKTTTAEWLVDTFDGELFRTDLIRKELFPDPDYTEAELRRTYTELIDRATAHAAAGGTAVLDATFYRRRERNRLRARIADLDIPLEFVEVDCAEPIVKDRIAEREGASDADFEVYLYYRYRFDPLRGEHLTVDNSNGLAETYAQLERYFDDTVATPTSKQPKTATEIPAGDGLRTESNAAVIADGDGEPDHVRNQGSTADADSTTKLESTPGLE